MALMDEGDHRYRYSVAWMDCLVRGRHLGRSVLTRGDFAAAEELPPKRRGHPHEYLPTVRLQAPPIVPSGLVNTLSMRVFNEGVYRRAPRQRRGELQSIPRFFHPLDGIAGWNRMYGHRGFLQWQFVVPFGAEATLRFAIESLSRAGVGSVFAVLKRFGPGDPGPLSFPTEGWTLALDLPVMAGLDELLDRLDRAVVEAGGRIYLAKDSRVDPRLIPLMYPRLKEWRAVRDRVDPDHVLVSDLDRRLHLSR
jgi:decaprenylphospho-beta-D-ribofuranose 2-oxidase